MSEAPTSAGDDPTVTHDALLRGRVVLVQPRDGYRANVDSLWLAAFARGKKVARAAIDLGAGSGAVGLAALAMGVAERVSMVDVDPEAIARARASCIASGLDARAECAAADLTAPLDASLRGRFDLALANPPYAELPDARPSPNQARARARTAPAGTLRGFLRAARQALGGGGRLCVVYPARAVEALFEELAGVGLEPKRLRFVHPLPDAAARVVLVEAKPARPGGLRIEPPLIAMEAPGRWSDEARAIVDGELCP
jgi:tRNA1Val (adenine37-N6)-methyltransferase